MRREHLRSVVITLLLSITIVSQSSPGWASHTGFDKGEYQASEGDGYVDLTVGAGPCCPAGSGQFDYHTADSSAFAGADYQQTSGTVTTATCAGSTPPVSTCTIRVPLISDEDFEGEELFEVRLSNFRGTFVPDRTTAVVRILDDDLAPANNSPIIDRSNRSRHVGGTDPPPPQRSSSAKLIEISEERSQMNSETSDSTAAKVEIPLTSSSKGPGVRPPRPQDTPPKSILTVASVFLAVAFAGLLILRNAKLKRSADE